MSLAIWIKSFNISLLNQTNFLSIDHGIIGQHCNIPQKMQPAPSGKWSLGDKSRGLKRHSRNPGTYKGSYWHTTEYLPCRKPHQSLSFLPQQCVILTKIHGVFWRRNVSSKTSKQFPVSRHASGGVQRMGLGLMLIQTVVNLRQEIKTEAAKPFGVGTLCSAQSKTTSQWNAICSRRLCWELHHRPKCSVFLMLPNSTSESTGREEVKDQSFPPAHQCVLGKVPACLQHWMSERVHPLTSTTNFGIRLCCLLSSGSRWLWPAPWTWRTSPWTYRRASCSWKAVSPACISVLERRQHVFPLPCHLPPQLQPLPSSAFSGGLLKNHLLRIFHSFSTWHFLEKPNLKRSHERSTGLLVFTLAFHFGGERWKHSQLQMGFFLSEWTFAPCTCRLSQRKQRRWTTSFRERGQVWKNGK